MRRWLAFALAWALVLGGGLLAHLVQPSNGAVQVSEVFFPAERRRSYTASTSSTAG